MKTLVVGPLEVNCYIIWDKNTKEAFIIDPGGDAGEIMDFIKTEGLKPKYIINTHGHFDHVGGNAELRSAYDVKVAIHRNDEPMLELAHEQAIMFGVKTPEQPKPDILLEGGETLKAGGLEIKVIGTPGHSKGGVCLYVEDEGVLFTGDTLFAGSIGRTDFQGGSYDELMSSVKTKILPLGDSVKVFPGHGPESTIGEEKRSNPFLTENR